ncbi:unnamed protein product, partial [Chrysoparadoxa australica]
GKSHNEKKDIEKNFQDMAEELEADLESARRFQSIYIPVARKLSIAQAKLFLKLISGEVPSRGLPMPLDSEVSYDWEIDDWPTAFEEIPPEKWKVDCIEWENSNLLTWDMRYIGVIVATSDILNQFPTPYVAAESVAGE